MLSETTFARFCLAPSRQLRDPGLFARAPTVSQSFTRTPYDSGKRPRLRRFSCRSSPRPASRARRRAAPCGAAADGRRPPRHRSKDVRRSQQEMAASKMLFAVVGYATCSSLMLVMNKVAVHAQPAPSFVLLCRSSARGPFKLVGCCGCIVVDDLEWNKLKAFLPVSMAFLACIFANIKTLQYANVETFVVFRASTPLFLAVRLRRPRPRAAVMRSTACLVALLRRARLRPPPPATTTSRATCGWRAGAPTRDSARACPASIRAAEPAQFATDARAMRAPRGTRSSASTRCTSSTPSTRSTRCGRTGARRRLLHQLLGVAAASAADGVRWRPTPGGLLATADGADPRAAIVLRVLSVSRSSAWR